MGIVLSAIIEDYDFWVSFWANMISGVLLAFVFGVVLTSVMGAYSEKRRSYEKDL